MVEQAAHGGRAAGRALPGDRARVGRFASDAARFSQAVREPVIASRLPSAAWPERNLVVTAVDAHSGAPRTFSRNDGVDLVRAVSASSAVPGLWPPVEIGGRWYLDGGVRSATNADLAAGYERVVVLAPVSPLLPRLPRPEAELAALPEGTRHALVVPSPEARAVFGRASADPARRAAAARAGRTQAVEAAVRVARVWGV